MGKKVEFVQAARGGMVVCVDDYMFRQSTKNREGTKYYYCASRTSSKCPASLQVRDQEVVMGTLKEGHTHPNHKTEIDKFKLIWSIRKRASEDPLTAMLTIYRQEMKRIESTFGPEVTARMPNFKTLETTLYRDRQKGFVGFPREVQNTTAEEDSLVADSEKWPNTFWEGENFSSKADVSENQGDRSEDNMQFDDHSNSEDSPSNEEGDRKEQECFNCTSLCPKYNLTKFSQPLKIKCGDNSFGHRPGGSSSSDEPVTVQEAIQRIYNVKINPTEPEPALCSYCVQLLASIYKPFREFRNLSIQSNSGMASVIGVRVKRKVENIRDFEDSGATDFSVENDCDDDDPLSEEETTQHPRSSRNLGKRDRPWQETSEIFHKKQRRFGPDQNTSGRNKDWKCVYCFKRFSENFILFYHNKEEHPDEDDEGGLYPNDPEPRRAVNHGHRRKNKSNRHPATECTVTERYDIVNSPEAEPEESDCPSPSNYEYHLDNSYPDNQSAAAALRAEELWQRKSSVPAADGHRVYYDCKFNKQCPAKLYLLWDNESRTIKFFRTSNSHNHEVQEKGLPAATKAVVEQLYKEGVTKQSVIIKILVERGFPAPKMFRLGIYIRQLRAELGPVLVNTNNGEDAASAFVPVPAQYMYGSGSNIFL